MEINSPHKNVSSTVWNWRLAILCTSLTPIPLPTPSLRPHMLTCLPMQPRKCLPWSTPGTWPVWTPPTSIRYFLIIQEVEVVGEQEEVEITEEEEVVTIIILNQKIIILPLHLTTPSLHHSCHLVIKLLYLQQDQVAGVRDLLITSLRVGDHKPSSLTEEERIQTIPPTLSPSREKAVLTDFSLKCSNSQTNFKTSCPTVRGAEVLGINLTTAHSTIKLQHGSAVPVL